MQTKIKTENDLYLKDLNQFCGTSQYYNVLGSKVTDGIKYVMNNGYAWVVTDFLALTLTVRRIRAEAFCAVELKLNEDGTAQMKVTDGNSKVLWRQNYEWTDAKKGFMMFYTDGVLMLAGEY